MPLRLARHSGKQVSQSLAQFAVGHFFEGKNMNFEAEFERVFVSPIEREELSDMGNHAKPVNALELQVLDNYERGARDCMNGVPHKPNQCAAYNQGFKAAKKVEIEK